MMHPAVLPQPANTPLATESQIISTLNSSIEDLLSKISKVQHDYEQSTHQTHPLSLLSIDSNLPAVQQGGLKSSWSKCETEASHSADQQHLQRQPTGKNNQIRTCHHHLSTANVSPPTQTHHHFSHTNSLRCIEPETESLPSVKCGKLQSLFDTSSIKEVASSQILASESEMQSTNNSILLQTREVQQIVVSSLTSSPERAKQDSEGLSLRDFEVGAAVGSGKFGEVYICRHRQTGLIFALKKVFKSTIREYHMEAQFCLEVKLLYLLNHPNIIKLYGHFSDDYHVFLLMEYVEGGQLMKKLGSDEKYVARVLEPLLEAMEHLHNRDIIHRDIKPENIVLAFDNTPKLCDFGWAASCTRNSMRQTFCGTLDYLSPEMKDGIDLWSLGVLTYQLLTGKAPFKEQMTQWRKKGSKRSDRWDWHISYPPSLSALAQSFMRNLLKENPDERASLRFCRNHFFIRKYKMLPSEINGQLYI